MKIPAMKIQVMEIQIGDRIFAYCNNKMQLCTVQRLEESSQTNVTLRVSTSHYRRLDSYVIRFSRNAFVDIAIDAAAV